MTNTQNITIRIAGFNGTSFSLFEGTDQKELAHIDQDATVRAYEAEVSQTLTEWAEGVTVEYTYLTADQNVLAEVGGYDGVTKWMGDDETLPGGLTKDDIERAEQHVWEGGRFWVELPANPAQ